MNDAFDARAQSRLHNVAGALDIGDINFVRIRSPQTIVGRYMKNVVHTGNRAIDRGSITQITFEKFDIESSEVRVRALLTDEPAHRKASLDEFVRDSRADEPACAGDENLALSVHSSRVPICGGFEPCRPIGKPASNAGNLTPKQLLCPILQSLDQSVGTA